MQDLLIALLAAAGIFLALQSFIIFGRPRHRRFVPLGVHQGTYETTEFQLTRPDGTHLQGWRAAPKDLAPTRVVIYFGGRKEDVRWASDIASHTPGAVIYSVNYRSFPGSSGTPSESRAKIDAQAIYAYVRRREPQWGEMEFTLIGRSLGSAIALWLSRDTRPDRLILLSPFRSVGHVLSWLKWGWAPRALLRQHFDCTALAAGNSTDTLVILAELDRHIPQQESLALCRFFPSAPQVQVIPGTNHATLPRSVLAQSAVAEFICK